METYTVLLAFGAAAGAIAAIWGLIEKISKPIQAIKTQITAQEKSVDDKLDVITDQLKAITQWQTSQQHDIEGFKEELYIENVLLFALSNWAIRQGAGEEVEQAMKELNEFQLRAAHEGRSYLKR